MRFLCQALPLSDFGSVWVGGGNQRISLRASHPGNMGVDRRGVLWGDGNMLYLDLVVITYWCIKYAKLPGSMDKVYTFLLHLNCAPIRYC